MITNTLAKQGICAAQHDGFSYPLDKWLNIARMQHDISRLYEPVGNNALGGLSSIASSLGSLARESLDLGEVEESKLLVSKGLMAGPENKELAQLQKELNDL